MIGQSRGLPAGLRVHRALVLLVCGLGLATGAQGQNRAQPSLGPNHLRLSIGTGLDWTYDGDGLGLSRGGPGAAAHSLIASLRYKVLRIPGGTLARTFDWAEAVDPVRGQARDWGGELRTVETGLPEFKRFAARESMRVTYTLNMSDPPAKSVALLERWRALPPRGGPDITSVELGNEAYTAGADAASAARYATAAMAVATAVRRAAPHVRIGATLYWGRNSPWDSVVVDALGSSVDFFVWHRYVPSAPYHGAASYDPTVAEFHEVERDVQAKLRLIGGRQQGLVLGEYNLSFQEAGTHQNVELLPRFYMLLGEFVYLAVKYDLDGLIKWQLVNPGWHTYADINFRLTPRPELSVSGVVSRFLQQWLGAQVSIGTVEVGTSDWTRLSALAGRALGNRPSFLVQNQDSLAASVHLPNVPGFVVSTRQVLSEDRGHVIAPRLERYTSEPDGTVRVPPFSLCVFGLRRAR